MSEVAVIPQGNPHEFLIQKHVWDWIFKHIDERSHLAKAFSKWIPPKDVPCTFGFDKECTVLPHGDSHVLIRVTIPHVNENYLAFPHGENFHFLDFFINWAHEQARKQPMGATS